MCSCHFEHELSLFKNQNNTSLTRLDELQFYLRPRRLVFF